MNEKLSMALHDGWLIKQLNLNNTPFFVNHQMTRYSGGRKKQDAREATCAARTEAISRIGEKTSNTVQGRTIRVPVVRDAPIGRTSRPRKTSFNTVVGEKNLNETVSSPRSPTRKGSSRLPRVRQRLSRSALHISVRGPVSERRRSLSREYAK